MAEQPPTKVGDIPVPSPASPQMQEQRQASVIDQMALRTAGQRRVHVIWETTQAMIAGIIVVTTMTICGMLIVRQNYVEAALQLVSNGFFLVIGFYFGRTNHARTGGVGGEGVFGDR